MGLSLVLLGGIGCGRERIENLPAPVLTFLESGCAASLRGLSTAADGTVWVSGSEGTVLRSIDGGASWQDVSVPDWEALDFRDIQAFSAGRALVLSAGSPAVAFRTTDGGSSWRETFRSLEPGVFFDGMAFWDSSNGAAFSDPTAEGFLVITTSDGGKSWSRIPSDRLPAPIDGEAGFAASGTCVAVQGGDRIWIGTGGGAARVLQSRDRGRTWAAVDVPLLRGKASQGIFSLTFWDADHGIAVGGDYRDPDRSDAVAARTDNGGLSWTVITCRGPGGFRSAVGFRPGSPGPDLVCAGTGGMDLSRDGGKTWAPITSTGFHALAFTVDGRTAWASGGEGRIARLDFAW